VRKRQKTKVTGQKAIEKRRWGEGVKIYVEVEFPSWESLPRFGGGLALQAEASAKAWGGFLKLGVQRQFI
jgi:hypothetical protein